MTKQTPTPTAQKAIPAQNETAKIAYATQRSPAMKMKSKTEQTIIFFMGAF